MQNLFALIVLISFVNALGSNNIRPRSGSTKSCDDWKISNEQLCGKWKPQLDKSKYAFTSRPIPKYNEERAKKFCCEKSKEERAAKILEEKKSQAKANAEKMLLQQREEEKKSQEKAKKEKMLLQQRDLEAQKKKLQKEKDYLAAKEKERLMKTKPVESCRLEEANKGEVFSTNTYELPNKIYDHMIQTKSDRDFAYLYYTKDEEIGQSSVSKNYKGVMMKKDIYDEFDFFQYVAIKKIPREKILCRAGNEITIMNKVQTNINVIELIKIIYTENDLYIITELCSGGELWDQIYNNSNNITEDMAKKYIRQIVRGVQHIHRCGIIHCDLKPQNILLKNKPSNKPNKPNEPILKIIDFDSSMILPNNKSQRLGTTHYKSPESFQKGKPLEFATDVWSIGIIMYQLLTKDNLPFTNVNNLHSTSPELEKVIIKAEITKEKWKLIPNYMRDAKDLIQKMLQKNPNKRISCEDILQHKWLQEKEA